MPKTISLWEKAKRIVAHLFEMETRLEIAERIEAARQAEIQKQLQLEHHQHLRSLMVENADRIEQWRIEKELERAEQEALEALRHAQEEEMRKRREAIELYRDNRRLQGASIYQGKQDSHVDEDMETTQE